MEKVNIKLLFLGHPRHGINKNKLLGLKSKYFKIVGIESREKLPEAQKNDGYLDVEYSVEEVSSMVGSPKNGDITFAIMNYRYDDGFYLHRLNPNAVCLSISGIDQLLINNGISLENFIIKNIYEVVALSFTLDSLCSDEAYDVVHIDTRGCLFDMNGDKIDIIYNTEMPSLCNECKSFINGKNIPEGFVSGLEKELKKIRKPFLSRVEIFIKKYPLFSIGLTLFSSFLISVLASLFVEYLKLNVKFSELLTSIMACVSSS
ncbi:hypothetical protein P0F15_003328 [Vibrio metschnikovii]|uniref:Uncharacterized protein n=2 Tax=Unclassified Bacteria TaxID=49928 RepID=A0AAU6T0Z9_UNCXX|nr:hypothetical protein [Vibrio metschnikovii]EKO3570233.1 hypothetical protein [Vibrio metschnikovii]EKO3577189.1 hypothetical protein [Vibrio metschnikovii]EKO3587384.1 hypothetical protein [Vibrio metschnikovii]EKO3597704.1 hypothetical protein [Vibrio metschnikovii]